MKPTQTGIAVALALAVVISFFIFPGLWPFGRAATQPATQSAGDVQIANNQDATSTSPSTMPIQDNGQLQIKDEVVGTGVTAEKGDTVTVQYTGMLMNGTVFDASKNHGDQGFSFTLGGGQVIPGWDQGLVGMKVGGKRMLVIPAALAYGDRAVGNVIPANSTLVFEVELQNVQKAK